MRYYHPFPEAIPLSEAGCSRVTHPSATKNKDESLFSVRLACVKRAASVRPEPGSNSLLNSIYQGFYSLKYLILFHNACVITAHFILFTWVSLISHKESQGSLLFALFNFQDTLAPFSTSVFRVTAYLLYHSFFILSIPFWNFFRIFFNPFHFLRYLHSLCCFSSSPPTAFIL